MHILMLGLGLIAPIGELANMSTSGKEFSARWELVESNKASGSLEFRATAFNQDKMNLDIFKLTEGIKIKFVKKTRIIAGTGLYYATREVNGTTENEWGSCSVIGIVTPLVTTKDILVRQELSWHTVPGGLTFTLHIGTKLTR